MHAHTHTHCSKTWTAQSLNISIIFWDWWQMPAAISNRLRFSPGAQCQNTQTHCHNLAEHPVWPPLNHLLPAAVGEWMECQSVPDVHFWRWDNQIKLTTWSSSSRSRSEFFSSVSLARTSVLHASLAVSEISEWGCNTNTSLCSLATGSRQEQEADSSRRLN